MRNWKTTTAGIAALLTALGNAFTQYTQGGLAGVDIPTLIASASAGIGLLAAKDHNVSGTGQ